MSLEQNSSDKVHQRPETWNDDHTLQADTVIPAPEHRDDKHDKKRMSLKTKVGLLLAGLGIAGTAGVVGKSMAGGENNAPAPRAPEASAPVTPGTQESQASTPEASATPEQEVATGEFGISAAEFKDNPEALVAEYYNQRNKYYIAGADEKAANADDRFEVTMDEYVQELSVKPDQAFMNDLFVEGWQDNQALVDYINSEIHVANITRRVRLETFSGGTEDKEPYVRETILDSVQVDSTDPLVTSDRWHEQDNRDMNTAEEVLEGDTNDNTGGSTFTWVEVDGLMKISDVSHNLG